MRARFLVIGLILIGIALWLSRTPVYVDEYNTYIGSGRYCVYKFNKNFCIYDNGGLCVALHKICVVRPDDFGNGPVWPELKETK